MHSLDFSVLAFLDRGSERLFGKRPWERQGRGEGGDLTNANASANLDGRPIGFPIDAVEIGYLWQTERIAYEGRVYGDH